MTSPPVWSFGRSQRSSLIQTSTPGPGAYAPFSYHQKKPQAWKIGTERKIYEYSNYKPGPGHYNNHLSNINQKEAPHYKFGNQLKKHQTTDQFTPGAGTYNPIQKTKRPPDYSFGFKDSKAYESIGPGPAHYNGNGSDIFNINRRPSSKIGMSQRSPLSNRPGTPGPDKYQISRPQSAGPKHAFGSSIRDNIMPDNHAFPGPGAYNHKSQLTKKSTTMISRRLDKTFFSTTKTPGPGAYNPNQSQHLPLSKMGFAMKDNFYGTGTPGPGQYNPDMANNRPRSASYKIGTSTRKPLSRKGKDTPGPGSYLLKSKLNEAPQYFMAKKYNADKIEGTPGPGHYEPLITQTNNRQSQQIIGTAQRPGLSQDAQQMPGPGQYDIRKCIEGPFISIGNALRNDENSSQEDPGPGAYEIPPKFADIPKYVMVNSTYKSSYNN